MSDQDEDQAGLSNAFTAHALRTKLFQAKRDRKDHQDNRERQVSLVKKVMKVSLVCREFLE